MKKLLADGNRTELFLIVAIFLVNIFIRFYNFENRVTYGPEQARSLIVASGNIKNGPSLLGQEYFRYSSQGHKLFYSATFTYSLIPLILLFNYDYIGIAGYFALLNLMTGLAVYLVTKKITNRIAALFSLVFFLFNAYMVYHSLFLWPYNYLPLFGILSVYLCYLFQVQNRRMYPFVLGVVSGIGFGIQFLYLPYALVFLVFLLSKSHRKPMTFLAFLAGAVIGNLPMVLFDLRNNFYHLVTLMQYFIDTLNGVSDASFNYYYLLPLWSIVSLVVGWLFYELYKKSKLMAIVLLVSYIVLNLNSSLIDFEKPTGMADGLTWKEIRRVAKVIADDGPKDFNVAVLLDFDTRGYILRYPIEYVYGFKPLGEEMYPEAGTTYALSRMDYDYQNPKVWELQVAHPYNIQLLSEIGTHYGVYRIIK